MIVRGLGLGTWGWRREAGTVPLWDCPHGQDDDLPGSGGFRLSFFRVQSAECKVQILVGGWWLGAGGWWLVTGGWWNMVTLRVLLIEWREAGRFAQFGVGSSKLEVRALRAQGLGAWGWLNKVTLRVILNRMARSAFIHFSFLISHFSFAASRRQPPTTSHQPPTPLRGSGGI